MWLLLPSLLLASPGTDAISEGDAAKYAGDRVTAREHYRAAAESADPAAQAMAHLRLMQLSGNFGMMTHGPKVDKALYIESRDPWHWLAWADFHLFLPAQLGADPDTARRFAEAAKEELPGPALARIYLATGDPEVLEELRTTPERDGLGDALVANDGVLPPQPGTWMLSLGVAGAPGAGFGGGVTFIHPDLGLRGWQLSVGAVANTRGGAVGSVSARSPGRHYGHGSMTGATTVIDLYDATGARNPTRFDLVQGTLGPGTTFGDFSVQAGMRVRWDALEGDPLKAAHGPFASVRWDKASGWGAQRRGGWASATVDHSQWGYEHTAYGLRAAGYLPFLKGVSAGRVTWDHELKDAPVYRLPSAGGSDLHRGAWVGRYRTPMLATADLEQRWMVWGPLELVLFGNVAWVDLEEIHPAGGGGIRLILPPEESNVVRIDVAVSDSAWGIYTAFGETF